MKQNNHWWKFLSDVGSGPGLLLLAALMSACSGTGDNVPEELSEIPDAVPKAEPRSKYGNPKSYVVRGKRYYTKTSSKGHVERGIASWYGKKFHGRKTSSGERYNMYAMTAAHKTLPLPTYAQVTNLENGRNAVVKINDRGPFHGNRIIDLSYSAARKLGIVATGTGPVEVRCIDPNRRKSGRQEGFFTLADAGVEPETEARKKAVAPRKSSEKRRRPNAFLAGDDDSYREPDSAEPSGKPRPSASLFMSRDEEPPPRRTSASSLYLQVGAFGSRANAEYLRRRLTSRITEQVRIHAMREQSKPWYKVRIGPLDTHEHAQTLSRQLAFLGLQKPHVIVE